ncbi:MAG: SURF1 family protein [Rhodoferax sp.]|nr:SURF1 family protein [Rhodoferax sp.]
MDYPVNARARTLAITLAAILGLMVTVSLGQWQLRRAAEKLALQAAIDSQAGKPALDGVALQRSSDLRTLVHQPVVLRGTWDVAHTVYLDNRQMQGRVGFFVMTPLVLEGTRTAIVVQRGWVARDFQNRSHLPMVQTPPGVVEVQGRMALPPSKLYAPGQEQPGAIRQNLDLNAYKAETGLPLMAMTLQQTGAASEGVLRDWPVVNSGVDKHYGYAAQWFALAALIAGLYLWFIVLRPRYFSSSKPPPHVQ